jgi:hypothetical protein
MDKKPPPQVREQTFDIMWLDDRSPPQAFVVEIDQLGPILRAGPLPKLDALREAMRLRTTTRKVRYG